MTSDVHRKVTPCIAVSFHRYQSNHSSLDQTWIWFTVCGLMSIASILRSFPESCVPSGVRSCCWDWKQRNEAGRCQVCQSLLPLQQTLHLLQGIVPDPTFQVKKWESQEIPEIQLKVLILWGCFVTPCPPAQTQQANAGFAQQFSVRVGISCQTLFTGGLFGKLNSAQVINLLPSHLLKYLSALTFF